MRIAILLGAVCAVSIAAVPAPSFASVQQRCLSLLDFPLAEQSKLSDLERELVTSIKQGAEEAAKGRPNSPSSSIHHLTSGFFFVITPALAKDQHFGTRSLTLMWRVNGFENSITHALHSPRVRFWSTINRGITTGYTFFGRETHLEVQLYAPDAFARDAKIASVSVGILTDVPDLEKAICPQ